MMSAAFKNIFLLTCLIVISGCRGTLTGAIPPSTEKPTLEISTSNSSQDPKRRPAPVMDQEDRIQIAIVSPNELIGASQKEVAAKFGGGVVNSSRATKSDLTIQKRKVRSRCCALW